MGTLEYIRYPMDLGELCRNVYEDGDRVQTEFLILDNKDTSLIINEDQNRIMQVVTNLITNAIKFTFKGEIRSGLSEGGGILIFMQRYGNRYLRGED